MDLVGAESKRGGTRGGRNTFTWDSVKKDEREYYLGNSVAGVTHRWEQPKNTSEDRTSYTQELYTVRRREKAMMDAALEGRSFADAVRSALAESGDGGVDDEGGSAREVTTERRRTMSKQERAEKAQRKLMRRQKREMRRRRRAERHRRRALRQSDVEAQYDSSESERESVRNRVQDDRDKPRKRKERVAATKRKRSDWLSSSDAYDSEGERTRRPRFRER